MPLTDLYREGYWRETEHRQSFMSKLTAMVAFAGLGYIGLTRGLVRKGVTELLSRLNVPPRVTRAVVGGISKVERYVARAGEELGRMLAQPGPPLGKMLGYVAQAAGGASLGRMRAAAEGTGNVLGRLLLGINALAERHATRKRLGASVFMGPGASFAIELGVLERSLHSVTTHAKRAESLIAVLRDHTIAGQALTAEQEDYLRVSLFTLLRAHRLQEATHIAQSDEILNALVDFQVKNNLRFSFNRTAANLVTRKQVADETRLVLQEAVKEMQSAKLQRVMLSKESAQNLLKVIETETKLINSYEEAIASVIAPRGRAVTLRDLLDSPDVREEVVEYVSSRGVKKEDVRAFIGGLQESISTLEASMEESEGARLREIMGALHMGFTRVDKSGGGSYLVSAAALRNLARDTTTSFLSAIQLPLIPFVFRVPLSLGRFMLGMPSMGSIKYLGPLSEQGEVRRAIRQVGSDVLKSIARDPHTQLVSVGEQVLAIGSQGGIVEVPGRWATFDATNVWIRNLAFARKQTVVGMGEQLANTFREWRDLKSTVKTAIMGEQEELTLAERLLHTLQPNIFEVGYTPGRGFFVMPRRVIPMGARLIRKLFGAEDYVDPSKIHPRNLAGFLRGLDDVSVIAPEDAITAARSISESLLKSVTGIGEDVAKVAENILSVGGRLTSMGSPTEGVGRLEALANLVKYIDNVHELQDKLTAFMAGEHLGRRDLSRKIGAPLYRILNALSIHTPSSNPMYRLRLVGQGDPLSKLMRGVFGDVLEIEAVGNLHEAFMAEFVNSVLIGSLDRQLARALTLPASPEGFPDILQSGLAEVARALRGAPKNAPDIRLKIAEDVARKLSGVRTVLADEAGNPLTIGDVIPLEDLTGEVLKLGSEQTQYDTALFLGALVTSPETIFSGLALSTEARARVTARYLSVLETVYYNLGANREAVARKALDVIRNSEHVFQALEDQFKRGAPFVPQKGESQLHTNVYAVPLPDVPVGDWKEYLAGQAGRLFGIPDYILSLFDPNQPLGVPGLITTVLGQMPMGVAVELGLSLPFQDRITFFRTMAGWTLRRVFPAYALYETYKNVNADLHDLGLPGIDDVGAEMRARLKVAGATVAEHTGITTFLKRAVYTHPGLDLLVTPRTRQETEEYLATGDEEVRLRRGWFTACLHPDCPVALADGRCLPAKFIRTGMTLVSMLGNETKVEAVTVRPSGGRILRVVTGAGRAFALLVTPEHRIATARADKWEPVFVSAGDLGPQGVEASVGGENRGVGEGEGEGEGEGGEDQALYVLYPVRRFPRHDGVLPRRYRVAGVNVDNGSKGVGCIEITPQLMELFGWYLARGYARLGCLDSWEKLLRGDGFVLRPVPALAFNFRESALTDGTAENLVLECFMSLLRDLQLMTKTVIVGRRREYNQWLTREHAVVVIVVEPELAVQAAYLFGTPRDVLPDNRIPDKSKVSNPKLISQELLGLSDNYLRRLIVGYFRGKFTVGVGGIRETNLAVVRQIAEMCLRLKVPVRVDVSDTWRNPAANGSIDECYNFHNYPADSRLYGVLRVFRMLRRSSLMSIQREFMHSVWSSYAGLSEDCGSHLRPTGEAGRADENLLYMLPKNPYEHPVLIRPLFGNKRRRVASVGVGRLQSIMPLSVGVNYGDLGSNEWIERDGGGRNTGGSEGSSAISVTEVRVGEGKKRSRNKREVDEGLPGSGKKGWLDIPSPDLLKAIENATASGFADDHQELGDNTRTRKSKASWKRMLRLPDHDLLETAIREKAQLIRDIEGEREGKGKGEGEDGVGRPDSLHELRRLGDFLKLSLEVFGGSNDNRARGTDTRERVGKAVGLFTDRGDSDVEIEQREISQEDLHTLHSAYPVWYIFDPMVGQFIAPMEVLGVLVGGGFGDRVQIDPWVNPGLFEGEVNVYGFKFGDRVFAEEVLGAIGVEEKWGKKSRRSRWMAAIYDPGVADFVRFIDSDNDQQTFVAFRVLSVETLDYQGVVYDFTVENDETFCIPMCAVHNSRQHVWGERIFFYRPNFYRRWRSHWTEAENVRIADPEHSWLPSPLHPLSPLTRVTDLGWWLREVHEDRPYALHPTFFDPGTMFGTVANMFYSALPGGPFSGVPEGFVPPREGEYPGTLLTANVPLVGADGIGRLAIGGGLPTVMRAPGGRGGTVYGLAEGGAWGGGVGGVGEGDGVAAGGGGGGPAGGVGEGGGALAPAVFPYNPSDTVRLGYETIVAREDLILPTMYNQLTTFSESVRRYWGLYGGIANLLPLPEPTEAFEVQDPTVATATSRMWGLGHMGEAGLWLGELGRRFVVVPGQDFDAWNPVPNRMPTWLPAQFRLGDPYMRTPGIGELSLPGDAFERVTPWLRKWVLRDFMLGGSEAEMFEEMLGRGRASPLSDKGIELLRMVRQDLAAGGALVRVNVPLEMADLGLIGTADIMREDIGSGEEEIPFVVGEAARAPEGGSDWDIVEGLIIPDETLARLHFHMVALGKKRGRVYLVDMQDASRVVTTSIQFSPEYWKNIVRKIEDTRRSVQTAVAGGILSPYEGYDIVTRLEILGKVAPNSPQYREAQKKALKYYMFLTPEERDRVDRATSQAVALRRRYNTYPLRHRVPLETRYGEILSIDENGNIVTDIGTFRMAGVKVKSDVLQMMNWGDLYARIGLEVGKRVPITLIRGQFDREVLSNAVLPAMFGGMGNSLNRVLVRSGYAVIDYADPSPLAYKAIYGLSTSGAMWEQLVHSDNMITNKLLRIRTALEQFKRGEVYGTDNAMWRGWLHNYVLTAAASYVGKDPISAGVGAAIFTSLVVREARAKRIASLAAGLLFGGLSAARSVYEFLTGNKWTPPWYRRQTEHDQYWDIIRYLKFKGLEEYAERRARDEEGIDLDRLSQDEKRRRLDLGPWTALAIYAEREARQTMYGYDVAEGTLFEALQAIPERHQQIAEEIILYGTPDEKIEFYRLLPDHEKRVLGRFLGVNPRELPPQTNLAEFFRTHFLPGPEWPGWDVHTDIEELRIRSLELEGMRVEQPSRFRVRKARARTKRVAIPRVDYPTKRQVIRELNNILAGKFPGIDVKIRAVPSPDANRLYVRQDAYVDDSPYVYQKLVREDERLHY